MRIMLTALCIAVLALGGGTAAAEPADVAAAMAAERPEADLALDESRDPAAVHAFLGLETGDDALDVVAGTGYYTEIMARAVGPEGRVVSHNPPTVISEYNLRPVLDARYGADRLPNVEERNFAFADTQLGRNRFDFVLMHLVYHDLYTETPAMPHTDPGTFLAYLFEAVKPGGIVGIVDHVGIANSDPREEAMRAHRIDPAEIVVMMENAGFELEEESDMFRNPADDHQANVFDPAIRGRTDRMVYRFRKPE